MDCRSIGVLLSFIPLYLKFFNPKVVARKIIRDCSHDGEEFVLQGS